VPRPGLVLARGGAFVTLTDVPWLLPVSTPAGVDEFGDGKRVEIPMFGGKV